MKVQRYYCTHKKKLTTPETTGTGPVNCYWIETGAIQAIASVLVRRTLQHPLTNGLEHISDYCRCLRVFMYEYWTEANKAGYCCRFNIRKKKKKKTSPRSHFEAQ